MKVKPLQYKLSEQTMKSVENQTSTNGEFDLMSRRNSKKGNTFVMIEADTSIMTYLTTIFYKNSFYASTIPSPTSLFFEQAVEFERNIELALEAFPRNVTRILGKDTKTEIKLVDPFIYNIFIIYKISAITALISSVESLANFIIPESYEIENSKKQTLGKRDIERQWDLKSKLLDIVPKLKVIQDIEVYKNKVNLFLELSKLRNEFIHLKTKLKDNNADPFIDHFETLINLDVKEKIEEVKNLLNLIEPELIK